MTGQARDEEDSRMFLVACRRRVSSSVAGIPAACMGQNGGRPQ